MSGGLTDSQKLDRLVALCEGMASTLVEHHVALTVIKAQVDVHADDVSSLSARIRDLKEAVEQLDKIAKGQDSRLREDRQSIHDLQRAEERRIASGSPDR